MRLDIRSITRSLLVTGCAVSALLLAVPGPVAASPGYASLSIGIGHHHHYSGSFHLGFYDPWVVYRPYGYWRYTPAGYPADYRHVGAVQLKVSPKKTDVYVDGQYVGRSGKFDGFPDYLWLDRGEHTLVFHRDGFRTLRERVRVRAGMITEVRLEMEPGESVEPSELYRRDERSPEPRAEPRPVPPDRPAGPRADTPAGASDRTLDLREEGGRVRLAVEPDDATVYLDGRFLGTGLDLERLHSGLLVEAGQHTLDVLHPRYRAERLSFRVEAGEDLEVRVTLDDPRGE